MKSRFVSPLLLLALVAQSNAADALPRDPNNVYGKFDNGLQYVIRHNANPPGRINMYLHVKTGALNESDAQNGLAHFLEHMAFNGSTHFPPGKLLPLLSGLGMTFGADTNAHTNLWETVYKLNLPDTEAKHIDLACQIFSDYAAGLSLEDDQIENERKVILEEYRTRLGAQKRIGNQRSRDLYAGTRLATHDIIGDAEQIKTFPAAQFREYYDRWYRPENMTLIVVGDVTPQDILPAAERWLAKIAARTKSADPQHAGLTPTTQPRAFVYTDPEQVAASVELGVLLPGEPPVTTVSQYRRSVLQAVAMGVVNRRYRNLITGGKAPFRGAGIDIDTFLNEVATASAEGVGEPKDWQAILSAVITEIDRAEEHGITEDEIKLIVRGLVSDTKQAVVSERTRDSSSVINEIAALIGTDRPLLSAQQRLDLLNRSLEGITAKDVIDAFKDAFATRNFNYVITLPSKANGLVVPSPADVLKIADAAWTSSTDAPTTRPSGDSLLVQEPVPGEIESQETDADLQVTTATFKNGVVLHHKFSDYKKDQVLISMVMPGGQLLETAENRGISALASVILSRPATSQLSSTQIADLFNDKNVSVGGAFTRDTLSMTVSGNRNDLPAGLQLIHVLMTDPVLEAAAVADWKKDQLQAIDTQRREPTGRLRKLTADILYGGEPRFQPLQPVNVSRLTGEDALAWFKQTSGHAAIEMTVVGDIPLSNAVELASRYVGSLPKRDQSFDALNTLRTIHRNPGPFTSSVTFDSSTPKALAIAGFISCDDDNPDRRPLVLAADILTNRMIDRIRKRDQLVYSIQASNQAGHGMPGSGAFTAGSLTDPSNGEKLANEILEMMSEFSTSGPTDAELDTAKRQIATTMTTSMRDPVWWLQQLSELSYRKRPLSDLKELPQVFDTFTKEQLQQVVAKYMTADRIIRFVVVPTSGVKAAPPTTNPN